MPVSKRYKGMGGREAAFLCLQGERKHFMKFRYKKITTAILALMITAAAAMTFTACGDSGSDSSADNVVCMNDCYLH